MTSQGCARRVMVVDDDSDIRDAIREVLQDGNYHPVLAADGASALDELRAAEPKPCVILLDVMMPVLDGKAFRSQQRDDPQLSSIPIVVLSAHADAVAAAAEMKAEGFLRKPVDLNDLLHTVEQFCLKE